MNHGFHANYEMYTMERVRNVICMLYVSYRGETVIPLTRNLIYCMNFNTSFMYLLTGMLYR